MVSQNLLFAKACHILPALLGFAPGVCQGVRYFSFLIYCIGWGVFFFRAAERPPLTLAERNAPPAVDPECPSRFGLKWCIALADPFERTAGALSMGPCWCGNWRAFASAPTMR